MKFDLKSMILGLALGLGAMFAIAAGNNPGPVGKYQIAGGSGFFLIVNTETGQAWAANLASPTPGFQTVHPGFWEPK